MDITITGKNLQVTEPLKNYTNEKLGRVEKFFHGNVAAHVILSVEKFRQKAEVTLTGSGTRIHSTEETSDMYSSIDKVVDKIEVQVRKHKEKIHTFKVKSPLPDETYETS